MSIHQIIAQGGVPQRSVTQKMGEYAKMGEMLRKRRSNEKLQGLLAGGANPQQLAQSGYLVEAQQLASLQPKPKETKPPVSQTYPIGNGKQQTDIYSSDGKLQKSFVSNRFKPSDEKTGGGSGGRTDGTFKPQTDISRARYEVTVAQEAGNPIAIQEAKQKLDNLEQTQATNLRTIEMKATEDEISLVFSPDRKVNEDGTTSLNVEMAGYNQVIKDYREYLKVANGSYEAASAQLENDYLYIPAEDNTFSEDTAGKFLKYPENFPKQAALENMAKRPNDYPTLVDAVRAFYITNNLVW